MVARQEVFSLYRSLLRAHKKCLPPELKQLGDTYVQSEFRLHKSATNPDHITRFMEEWTKYLHQVESTARARDAKVRSTLEEEEEKKNVKFGRDLQLDVELTPDQRLNLHKLRDEAVQAGKSGSNR